MATHSSTLAWKIPWTEEPGGLKSIGLQRVEQNRTNLESTHAQYFSPQLFNKILGISSTFTQTLYASHPSSNCTFIPVISLASLNIAY